MHEGNMVVCMPELTIGSPTLTRGSGLCFSTLWIAPTGASTNLQIMAQIISLVIVV